MTYRGMSKEEGLAKLTEIVRAKLSMEGLNAVFFEAYDVVSVYGHIAMILTLLIPETLSVADREKAKRIAGDETLKFLNERYSRTTTT